MTNLVQIPSKAAPGALPMSTGLAVEVGLIAKPDPLCRPRGNPRLAAEADRLLPDADARCRPVTFQELLEWLGPINFALANPTDMEDLAQFRVPGIMLAVGDLPAAAFNPETQREGAKRWKFFPSGAEVAELLEPHAKLIRNQRHALRQIADYRPHEPGPERGPPTDEARAAVRHIVAGWTQEVARREQRRRDERSALLRDGNPSPVSTMSPALLLAIAEDALAKTPKCSQFYPHALALAEFYRAQVAA